MNEHEKMLNQATHVMRWMGWGLIALPAMLFIYPPGFLWGAVSPEMCFVQIGPEHPPSPYDALHPYLFMIAALYVSLGLLLVRGANDPRANTGLFDFAILSSALHAAVMIPQSFYYPNEHAHLWADVPLLLVMMVVFWHWHPTRIARKAGNS